MKEEVRAHIQQKIVTDVRTGDAVQVRPGCVFTVTAIHKTPGGVVLIMMGRRWRYWSTQNVTVVYYERR